MKQLDQTFVSDTFIVACGIDSRGVLIQTQGADLAADCGEESGEGRTTNDGEHLMGGEALRVSGSAVRTGPDLVRNGRPLVVKHEIFAPAEVKTHLPARSRELPT